MQRPRCYKEDNTMVKALELIAKGTSSTKYIMFIDFKQAYDSIKHMMFFENLEKMGTPESVVNTMKKLLS